MAIRIVQPHVKNADGSYDELKLATAQHSDTATNATMATYASNDTTKGTIEERLTNLGFRQGVVGNLVATALTNYLKRQGNYVIGNLDINSFYNDPQETDAIVLGVIPAEFRPAEVTYVRASMAYGYSSYSTPVFIQYHYGSVLTKIDTNGQITMSNYSGDTFSKLGDGAWQRTQSTGIWNLNSSTIYGFNIQFGYEAAPLN